MQMSIDAGSENDDRDDEAANERRITQATTPGTPLSADELVQIKRFHEAVRVFLSRLSIEQLHSFLTIAENPGLSVNELAERAGITQQSASRHVRAMVGRLPTEKTFGPFHLKMHISGADLLVQGIRKDDPRSRSLEISEIGRETLNRVIAALNGDTPTTHSDRS